MTEKLNTTTIANSGAAIVAASVTVLSNDLSQLSEQHPVSAFLIILPIIGVLLGALLCYLGRPSTIAPPLGKKGTNMLNWEQLILVLEGIYDKEVATGGAKTAADKIVAITNALVPIASLFIPAVNSTPVIQSAAVTSAAQHT